MLNMWNKPIPTAQPIWSKSNQELSLAELHSGTCATIVRFDKRLPADQRENLQVYGITPGQTIRMLQHKPVTVVQIDQTELAFEIEIARLVTVRRIEKD